jgi:hypothetical protein
MQIKKVKNKQGEVLTTKEGEPLTENRFEPGDQFIPQYNTVLEKVREVEKDGKKKKIPNYFINAKVKNKDGNILNNGENIFITLTQTQAERLKQLADEGTVLNQNLFVVYSYENQYGDQIGITLKKDNTPQADFTDFEEGSQQKQEQEQKQEAKDEKGEDKKDIKEESVE